MIETCHVDTRAISNNGQSAYGIAVANNKSEVVEYLQNRNEITSMYGNGTASTMLLENRALDRVR